MPMMFSCSESSAIRPVGKSSVLNRVGTWYTITGTSAASATAT